jgi:hypothetical protein
MQRFRLFLTMVVAAVFTMWQPGCSKDDDGNNSVNDVWDIDKDGIPQFVAVDYIELNKIYRISKYRSSFGHDYSDAFEQCRSMKHYFQPFDNIDWTTVKVYSPVTGVVTRVEQEWTGTKVEIAADNYPAFRFQIFHMNLTTALVVGDNVQAGDQLGTHVGSQTMSDISVIVNDPTHQGRMVSYFQVMTDDLFATYQAHGVASRNDLMISKELRDANPLTCNGDTFTSVDVLDVWFVLSN